MKKEKIERIVGIIIALSVAGIIVADLFFAYYMDNHNAAGLMNFGYTTNLTFLIMFSCPVVLAIVSSVEFVKEMILARCGEGEKRKQKLITVSFASMLAGVALYLTASSITSTVAITLGGVSALLLVVSVTALFIYFVKR